MVYSYDCDDNLLSERWDIDCDCSYDECREYKYNAYGAMIEKVYDRECKSNLYNCTRYTYDERGNTLKEVYDISCNGENTICRTFTYDQKDNVITEEYDDGCNGASSLDRCNKNSYDEQGELLTEVEDIGCNGPSPDDRCRTFSYNTLGNMLTEVEDRGCDGPSIGDNCLTYTYDDRGNILTEGRDDNCDVTNRKETSWHYIYDDQDRLLMKMAGISPCYFTTYDRHGNEISTMVSQDCKHVGEWGCGTTKYQCADGDTWTDSATGGDGDTDTETDSGCSGPCVRPTGQEDCRDGWCRIAAGCFTMPHEVRLTRDFEMMTAEMTRGQFQSLVGYAPVDSSVCGGTDCPLRQVSWHEALKAANALSAAQGYPECFDCNTKPYPGLHCRLKAQYARPQDCPGYRLPTEAEWQLASDGWGLQGINDTVTEWVWDWYGDYPQACVTDPVGPATGLYRVYRRCNERVCMTNKPGRDDFVPAFRYADLGFRLARTLPAPTGGDGDIP